MSLKLTEKLRNGVVVFDVDGVLAAYEFGDDCHYAPVWEEAFRSISDNPYCSVNPLPVLQQFVASMPRENIYVCSVAAPFEREAKAAFVLRHYAVLADHIYFVQEKAQKIDALRSIQQSRPGLQIALVDDTVKTLDAVYDQSDFLTVHISSFFDYK